MPVTASMELTWCDPPAQRALDTPAGPVAAPCTTACPTRQECPFCALPLCTVHEGSEETVEACEGLAHEACHRGGCRDADCWADPDGYYDAQHEA